jgi:DtxR family transcriptional regulator, Mn-dependent transcriptional regulator
VHEIAEELEHVRSAELVTRLDAYLGCPQFDPHGDPIPTPAGDMPQTGYRKLSEAIAGESVRLMAVLEHSTEFLQHLDHSHLTLGSVVAVAEINAFDKSVLVAIESGRTVFISYEVAKNLLVS